LNKNFGASYLHALLSRLILQEKVQSSKKIKIYQYFNWYFEAFYLFVAGNQQDEKIVCGLRSIFKKHCFKYA